jgi:hypothetical protein
MPAECAHMLWGLRHLMQRPLISRDAKQASLDTTQRTVSPRWDRHCDVPADGNLKARNRANT